MFNRKGTSKLIKNPPPESGAYKERDGKKI